MNEIKAIINLQTNSFLPKLLELKYSPEMKSLSNNKKIEFSNRLAKELKQMIVQDLNIQTKPRIKKASLREQVEKLTQMVIELQAENIRLNQRIVQLEIENAQLRAENAELRAENAELRVELFHANQRIGELEVENRALRNSNL
ncbi:hypothetical protein [Williamsoniiplasma luminosum]|uniref:Uncharacterized protein n=1 Tax=Williamsoniiplasma luminosum TaxID=214888 RepID=A0A2S0NJ89_9MOLU|nr:hypothetical protein [Williamsoniiplasma luminosum]AVP49071.1 MAG: hypothetical protein C5T88_00525 [Williamsoniiplasma luminosum]